VTFVDSGDSDDEHDEHEDEDEHDDDNDEQGKYPLPSGLLPLLPRLDLDHGLFTTSSCLQNLFPFPLCSIIPSPGNLSYSFKTTPGALFLSLTDSSAKPPVFPHSHSQQCLFSPFS
jgi:hypothetical protein